MWELYSLEYGGPDAQKSYVVPVGEDTLGTPDFVGAPGETYNGGTYLVVQSTADDTLVNYTIQGVDFDRSMMRGDTFVIEHVYQGDTVEANNKIQVGMIASGGEAWDIRYFTLQDTGYSGNDYWIPTFPPDYPELPIRFHIYAITDSSISIETAGGMEPGWNVKAMSAGTVDTSYTTLGTKPLHIYAGLDERIIILVAVDTNEGLLDWGYVPVDSSRFSTEYFIPYAPSGKNRTLDMQMFVSPLFDDTTIYADYDQDGVAEESVNLDRCEAYGFYNPDEMDNTGTHLYSDFEFTVVYGETAYAESGGDYAGYDWGYSLLPPITSDELVITKEISLPVAPPCTNIKFTLNVTAGNVNVSDVDIWDILPENFTYKTGTTIIVHPDSSMSYPDPSITGQELLWDLDQYLNAGESMTVEFDVESSNAVDIEYMNLAVANGTDPYGNVFTPEARAFGRLTANAVIVGSIMDISGDEPEPVPGVTVYLTNCTDGTILNDTSTRGDGLYYFLNLTTGEYCVHYDTGDGDLGDLIPYSDDDPTQPVMKPYSSSANFSLPPQCLYEHNFMVSLPVDLNIQKTGPTSAIRGATITYTYTVINEGLTDAADVQVTDDVCGPITYMGGDTDGDSELDPGETWIYSCQHTVQPGDPDPLVNIVNVTTSDVDEDPSDDEDTWTVDLLSMGFIVEKTLESSSMAFLGDTVVFKINITNNGDASFHTVPLNDTYDPTVLEYKTALPPPDDVTTPGLLLWDDLTGAGSLTPGQSILVQVNYTAIGDSYPDVTVNHANVSRAAVGEGLYMHGYDNASLTVAAPDITVDKTLLQPSGGTVSMGDNIVFQVKVTNSGDTPLITVPLDDYYDPVKLEYTGSTITPDTVLPGHLRWDNITSGGALGPANSITIEITFKAVNKTTPDYTENIARVVNATTTIPRVLLGDEDTAEVKIAFPVGGEVIRPNLQYVWSIVVLLLLAYVFRGLKPPKVLRSP